MGVVGDRIGLGLSLESKSKFSLKPGSGTSTVTSPAVGNHGSKLYFSIDGVRSKMGRH